MLDYTIMRIRAIILFMSLLAVTSFSSEATAQNLDYEPKVLLVTAHPDDDALFSATVFKTSHLLNGDVDLALMTNGEGGYKYSTLGNYIYDRQLDKEKVGREYLPGIRKRELMAGGKIVGLRNYFFFDQVDKEYSEDISNPLKRWDIEWVKQRLKQILKEGNYDFVFTMMPSKDTHAHHKASAILALQAVESLPEEERPLHCRILIFCQKAVDHQHFAKGRSRFRQGQRRLLRKRRMVRGQHRMHGVAQFVG